MNAPPTWHESDLLGIVAFVEAAGRESAALRADDQAAYRWAVEDRDTLLRCADLELVALGLATILAGEHRDDLEWWSGVWRWYAGRVGERTDER